MWNKFGFSVYCILCLCITTMAVLVLNYSMKEPFELVLRDDLVWQLILPSMFFSLSIVGIIIGFMGGFHVGRLIIGISLIFLCVDLVIFSEAIYGYLWDLRVHVGI